jgi:hypothetical protein
MQNSLFMSLGIATALLFAGCKKKSEVPPPPRQADTQPETRTVTTLTENACRYLTNEEIQQVQGASVKDSKGSGSADGHVQVLQCYYAAEPSNRSVSLMVTQNDPKGTDARAAKQTWETSFGRYDEKKKQEGEEKEKAESLREQKRGRGEEEEEGKVPMKKIEGVGEEAFWSGSRVGGALYVLKNGAYIRVSIGGPDPEEEKIKKTKVLAEKALARLP